MWWYLSVLCGYRKDDPKEVKNTKFFRGVDWVALIAKQVAPPKL